MTERDPNLESTTIANGAERSIPTARVGGGAGGTASGRGGATRWGIALVIVALVVGVGAAGAFLLTGASSPSTVLAYAPADAVAYSRVLLEDAVVLERHQPTTEFGELRAQGLVSVVQRRLQKIHARNLATRNL